MTNAQKWLAAFLVVFVVLFYLERLTQKEETPPDIKSNINSQNNEPAGDNDAFALIKQNGCTNCHGQNLEGTQVAPAIKNIKDHWTRDALINYLRNPSSYSGDKRFDEYRQKYKNIMMPSFGNLDVKILGEIADYLIER